MGKFSKRLLNRQNDWHLFQMKVFSNNTAFKIMKSSSSIIYIASRLDSVKTKTLDCSSLDSRASLCTIVVFEPYDKKSIKTIRQKKDKPPVSTSCILSAPISSTHSGSPPTGKPPPAPYYTVKDEYSANLYSERG